MKIAKLPLAVALHAAVQPGPRAGLSATVTRGPQAAMRRISDLEALLAERLMRKVRAGEWADVAGVYR